MHTPEYLEERLRYELKQQEPAYDLKTTPQLPFAQDEENYTMEAWKDGAVPPLFEDVTQRRRRRRPRPTRSSSSARPAPSGGGSSPRRGLRARLRRLRLRRTPPTSRSRPRDPSVARDVTVGGMERLLRAMKEESDATRMLFSDSIGSFGGAAPREDATARWLAEHPEQDPGSDYGRQKRAAASS
ncbi:L-threonine 3-dehydrogenase [Aureococcus anophagefferens]|nr:L-threonine 3-dehydrogenase [Aureococcus anophagefferens]